jgi:hypothetical protein
MTPRWDILFMSTFAASHVTIRESRPEDSAGIRRLAALDSAPVPRGAMLLAEVDGRLLAALALPGGRAIADPFAETAPLVRMLRAGSPPPPVPAPRRLRAGIPFEVRPRRNHR